MRKFLFLAGIGWLMVGSAARGTAETARELFDALPTKIRAEAEAKRNGKIPQGEGQSDPGYLLSFFRNARESLERGDDNSATQQLRQLEYAAVTDPVRDGCEAVITTLRKEHEEKETAANAEVAGVLLRAREAILKAKTPKDLDLTLQELSQAGEKRDLGRSFERGNETFVRRLQNAAKFVARWQDHLVYASRNESGPATEVLRSLMSDSNDALQALGLPRSEIVTRIPTSSQYAPTPAPKRTVSVAETNAAIETALNRLKTLDDLPPVIHDLTAFRDEALANSNGYGSSSGELGNTLSSLQSLQQASLEIQSGVNRSQGAWLDRFESSSVPRADARLVALRAQLIALSLPRVLGAPITEKPAADERVDAFFDRLLAAAKKRGDWQAVARGVESRRLLAPNSAYEGGRSDYNGDETAFKQFFAGQNYEQAGQYEQAVVAYLAALSTGSQEIPVAVISERLAAIKQNHPAEYTGGNRTNSTPGSDEYRALRRAYRLDPPAAPAELTITPVPSSPASTPTPTASLKVSP